MTKKPIAFLAVFAVLLSVLLYFPEGTFGGFVFVLKYLFGCDIIISSLNGILFLILNGALTILSVTVSRAVTFFVIDVAVNVVMYINDLRSAKLINRGIREIQSEKRNCILRTAFEVIMKKELTAAYSTSRIAEIVGLHPNTVRMYEEWGLIHKPERKKNGYRVFNDIHIKQFELARKALQIEALQAGLRSRIVNAVKLSAQYRFEEAIEPVREYIRIAEQEKENAKEAAEIIETLYRQQPQNDGIVYNRSQAAKELGLTIDTIRNREMNGLLTVKRKQNGYRVYDSNDINRLKIIRSLRCANYSLSAILRMLKKYIPIR